VGKDEAEDFAGSVGQLLRRIKQKLITVPAGVAITEFVVSGGKGTQVEEAAAPLEPVSSAAFRQTYLDAPRLAGWLEVRLTANDPDVPAGGVTITFTASGGAAPDRITFTASGGAATAVLSGATAVTDAGGTASVTATANGGAGSYRVTAAPGVAPVVFVLTNLATPTPPAPPTETVVPPPTSPAPVENVLTPPVEAVTPPVSGEQARTPPSVLTLTLTELQGIGGLVPPGAGRDGIPRRTGGARGRRGVRPARPEFGAVLGLRQGTRAGRRGPGGDVPVRPGRGPGTPGRHAAPQGGCRPALIRRLCDLGLRGVRSRHTAGPVAGRIAASGRRRTSPPRPQGPRTVPLAASLLFPGRARPDGTQPAPRILG
jgi:hypothetical protein